MNALIANPKLTSYMYSVSAKDVVVTRSGYAALANGTFDLHRKFFVIVTGANGSGKTTLLKSLAGLTSTTRGQIKIEISGQSGDSSDPRSLRKLAAYVGHTPLYMRHISVKEHLELVTKLDILQGPSLQYVMSVDEVLQACHLKEKAETEVEHLSAGQKRRLHFGSSLLRTSPILCLDEPHASLDKEFRKIIDDLIFQQYENGRSFVVATHDQHRLEKFATHKIVMQHGVTNIEEASQ